MRSLLFVAFLLCFSCSERGRGGGGASSRNPGSDASTRADAPLANPDASIGRGCFSSPVTAETELVVDIEQACAIWNSLGSMNGEVTISKSDESLVIDFGGGVRFSGLQDGNQVVLLYDHEHPFSDGCQWRAAESLEGTINTSTCDLTVRYDYAESVVQSNGACATPCSASANVDITFTVVR